MGPIEAFRLYLKVNKVQESLERVRFIEMSGWKSKAGFILMLACAGLRGAEASGFCHGCTSLADAIGTLGVGFLGVGIAHKIEKAGNGS